MRHFTLVQVADAVVQRLGERPLYRFVDARDNELTHSRDYKSVELKYGELPYQVVKQAMTGLTCRKRIKKYESRPWTHRGQWSNDVEGAQFCLDMRRYKDGTLVFIVSPWSAPIDREALLKEIEQDRIKAQQRRQVKPKPVAPVTLAPAWPKL